MLGIILQMKQLYPLALQVFLEAVRASKGLCGQAKECVSRNAGNITSLLFNSLHMEPLYSVLHSTASQPSYQKSFLSLFNVSVNTISKTAGVYQRTSL